MSCEEIAGQKTRRRQIDGFFLKEYLMDSGERLKVYQGFAENTRKWVSVMDAKAGFISAMNAGVLTFIWSGAKLALLDGAGRNLALVATAFSLVSLFIALCIVLPRITLDSVFGEKASYSGDYAPISFFAYVADKFTDKQWPQFHSKVDALDEKMLGEEQLEQHFTISHVLKKKSTGLVRAGVALLASVAITGLALFAKEFC